VSPAALLGYLLAGDLLFLLLHLFHVYSERVSDLGLSNPVFSLAQEQGLAEIFQYLKFLCTALLLLVISRRQSNLSYLSWSALFLYLLLDDSLQLHERGGAQLAAYISRDFALAVRLRVRDVGELIVALAAGLGFLGIIATAWHRGGDEFREFSRRLIVLLALLFLFGVVTDMVHEMVRRGVLAASLQVLEDGGEMIVMSVVCWYVYQFGFRVRPDLHALKITC
jgi:hypothetical protein